VGEDTPEYKDDLICDVCDYIGAYNVMGINLCAECLAKYGDEKDRYY